MAHKGITSLEFIPQPDFRATQSENGGWTASQSFVFLGDDLDSYSFREHFRGGRRATDLDESLPSYWDILNLISVEVAHEEAGSATIVVNYSGSQVESSGGTGENAEVITYSLSGSLSQRSIIEHPKVRALDEADRLKLGQLLAGNIKYIPNLSKYYEDNGVSASVEVSFTAGDSATFAKKIVEDIVTYDHATFTWTEYKERRTGLSASELNNVGKVDTPSGSPPNVTGGRDWRLVSATQDYDGSLYRISRQWELSDSGGWDEDLYDD